MEKGIKEIQYETNEQAAFDALPVLFLLKLHESGTPLDLAKAINSITKWFDVEDKASEKKGEIITYIGRKCLVFLADQVDDSRKMNLLESVTKFYYDFYEDESDIIPMRSLTILLATVYLARNVLIKDLKDLEDISNIITAQIGIKELIREEYEATEEFKEKVLLGEIDAEEEFVEIFPEVIPVSEMIINMITETGFSFLTDKIETSQFLVNFSKN